jgi:hypothetical protein
MTLDYLQIPNAIRIVRIISDVCSQRRRTRIPNSRYQRSSLSSLKIQLNWRSVIAELMMNMNPVKNKMESKMMSKVMDLLIQMNQKKLMDMTSVAGISFARQQWGSA